MRSNVTFLACFSIMAVLGCSSIPDTPISNPIPISETADERALVIAAASVRGMALTLEAAVDAGQLKGEKAAKAKVLLEQAFALLKAAQTAHTLGNAVQVMANTSNLQNVIGKLSALVPVEAAK